MKAPFLLSSLSLSLAFPGQKTSRPLSFDHPGGGGRRRRLASQDFGFSGNTPEEVCASVKENYFFDGFVDKFATECQCERKPLGSGYTVSCVDTCEYSALGVGARYSVDFELDENLFVETWKPCDDFNVTSFDGIKLCEFADYTTDPPTEKHFVNGEECRSTSYWDCNYTDVTTPIVDCSNLGYGSNIDYCQPQPTLPGPFGFQQLIYFGPTVDDYSRGTCSPPQCQQQLDSTNLCTESQLSEEQKNECTACVIENLSFLFESSSTLDNCVDANELSCSKIEECDEKCGTCQEHVEDFSMCQLQDYFARQGLDCQMTPCPEIPPQCQGAVDAMNSCIENDLTRGQSAECTTCVSGALSSILTATPDRCDEAANVVCALINQCDNECLVCESSIEEAVECLYEDSLPQCDIDCTPEDDSEDDKSTPAPSSSGKAMSLSVLSGAALVSIVSPMLVPII